MPSENNTPAIRFAGFTGEWKQSELKNEAIVRTGFPFDSKDFSEDGEFLVITNGNIQDEFSEVDNRVGNRINVANNQLISQYSLNIDDILVTMDGTVGRSAKVAHDKLILAQRVGRLTANREAEFLYQALNTGSFYESMTELSHGGTIKHISLSEIGQYKIAIPSDRQEEKQIGNLFQKLDTIITLYRRKCERLETLKKSMLEKLFPKEGKLVPELRFAGFTGEWERRELGKLLLIERGASPRPIDSFITEREDGLNWIKIGDAPLLGKYITTTAEKIRPEGLSKTKVVQPGDLILSNSMSFGRPYIMGISGCIHDGWLLIRDTRKIFDVTFICHLLGSGFMLNQYRTLAAGSTVNNLNKELVGSAIVQHPSTDEQKKIGFLMERIDTLLTLHRRKLELLKNIKKACLEKMFV